jgi:MSHA biogenesis protein MshN
MSLINEVLRDLDKRHAPANELGGMPNEVRSLPSAPARRDSRAVRWWLALPLVMAVGFACFQVIQTALDADATDGEGKLSAATPMPLSTPTIAVSPAPTYGESATPAAPAPVAALGADTAQPVAPAESVDDAPMRLKIAMEISLPLMASVGQKDTPPEIKSPQISTPAPAVAVTVAAPVAAPVPSSPAAIPSPAKPANTAVSKAPIKAPMNAPVTDPAPKVAAPTPTPPSMPPTQTASADKRSAPPPAAAQEHAPIKPTATSVLATDDVTKAQVLLKNGQTQEGESMLRRLIDAQPSAIAPRQALITSLLSSRRFAEAIPVLKTGVSLNADQTSWAINLARLHAETGDYNAAWDALAKGLPRAQQQPEYLAFAGTVLQRLGRSPEAVAQYQAALRLRPEEARWWVGLGLALESSQRAADAQAAFMRAKTIGDYSPDMARFVDQKLQ